MRFLVAIIFFFLIPLLSFRLVVFNFSLYQFEFKKVDVYQYLDPVLADQKAKEVINFHQGKGNLDTGFFSQNEISHLEDVRKVIQTVNGFATLTLIAFTVLILTLVILKKFKQILIGIKLGSFLTIAVVGLTSILTLFFFDLIFELFHKVVFKSNYLFSQSDSNLVNLFPPEFFADFAAYLALVSTGSSLVVLLLVRLIDKLSHKR